MSEYVVRISAVASDFSESDTSVTARIEIVGGEAHVVEFTVRAPVGSGLAPGDLPFVDLEKLASAFASVDRTYGTPAGAVTSVKHSAALSPPRRPKRRRAAPNSSARHVPTGGNEVPSARAYRRMPDPDSLQTVYTKVGSIAGVARHYGVPSHTAQGWIGRLRKLQTAPAGSGGTAQTG